MIRWLMNNEPQLEDGDKGKYPVEAKQYYSVRMANASISRQ